MSEAATWLELDPGARVLLDLLDHLASLPDHHADQVTRHRDLRREHRLSNARLNAPSPPGDRHRQVLLQVRV